MNTINKYKKHLTLSERIKIESHLNQRKSFRKMSEDIGKAHNTISREVQERRIKQKGNNFNGLVQNCCYRNKSPYVCNGCESRKGCRKNKYFYRAEEAQKNYRHTLIESRVGINMESEDFVKLDRLVKKLVNQGHSFSQIIMNNPELNISKRTLYNYQENNYLSTKNIDLPRKVRYKVRKSRSEYEKDRNKKIQIDKCREGRTYNDLQEHLCSNNIKYYSEMDTVEGDKGTEILLTLFLTEFHILLAFKLKSQTIESVNNKISKLKEKLGYELFYKLFHTCATDNGKEFKRPEIFEDNGEVIKKSKLFYCDPRRSDQKGSIEVAHEYIRRYIPKGFSFNKYTDEQINNMINHINNVPRESLNGNTPYNLLLRKIGIEGTKKLDLYYINPNDVILKSSLFSSSNEL